jgi:predicted DNA-binding transcriptional regulator AlpA
MGDAMSGNEPGGLRLVYFEDLEPRFGIKFSEMTIHRKMNADPPQFPRNVLIGQRKAWYEHKIVELLKNLPTGKGRDPDPGNKRKGRKRASKRGVIQGSKQ